ncbi:MAG: fimbrillin family protein [Bacteroidaceae bacterium]|nr:fimbrillin family protein [Bacteroidaceae bacterium]
MKKNLLLMLSLLVFMGCSSKDDNGTVDEPIQTPSSVSFKAFIKQISRATETAFEDGDAISVFAVDPKSPIISLAPSGNYANNVQYIYNGTNFSAGSNAITIGEKNTTGLAYYAMYPYQSDASDYYKFNVRLNQTKYTDYTASDLCTAYAEPTTADNVLLEFNHRMSCIVVKFHGENLASKRIGVKLNNISVACYADINANTYKATGVKNNITMGEHSSNIFQAIIVPQTISSDQKFLTVTLDGKEYPLNLPSNVEFKSGKKATYEFEIEDDKIIALNGYITPWDTYADITEAEGIIEVTSGIGDYDAAYLTKYGFFCYDKNFGDGIKVADKPYNCITYMPIESSELLSLISTNTDNIPSQLISDKGIVYFSFPNDSILELLYDDGKEIKMLDSIPYSKKELINVSSALGDPFKASLFNASSLLKKNKSPNSITNCFELFELVSNEPYVENKEIIDGLSKDESGNFKFVETVAKWDDDEVKDNVCNTLSLWTGKATYKVGGSSCTLSGTIFCTSDAYNTYGTYGIICDSDLSKLSVGNAEYEGTGYQSKTDLSYGVDFRGLKPNTTYYYKAFYKFNSSDHGGLVPKYGSPTDQIIYDTTVKSFTTGDNNLTVDVVMCIDVTGSMSGIINTVKSNAIAFYDLFKNSCEEEGIQLTGLNSQVIAFQDINNDGDKWIKVSPTYSLPDQKANFNEFVNALYADDGGDIPESGLEALNMAFDKADWGVDDGYHRQVIILWTDAPYLVGSNYTSLTVDGLNTKWNKMPSGRRLILFAPYGSGYSNGGDWGLFDDWTNVIHESDLDKGFNNFEYILKSIIGELTSKAPARKPRASVYKKTNFRPNN